MKKIVIDGVDMFNPFQDDKKNKVIEYFVQYYGEKYRDRITQRINDATICFVGKMNGWIRTSESLRNYYKSEKNAILKQFYSNFTEETTAENLIDIKPIQLKILNENGMITSVVAKLVSNLYLKDKNLNGEDGLAYRATVEFLKDEKNYQMFKNDLKKMLELWDKKYSSKFEKLENEQNKYYTQLKDIEDEYFESKNKNEEKALNLISEYLAKVCKISSLSFKMDLKCKRMSNVFLDILEKKGELTSYIDEILYVELFNFLGVKKGRDYQNYKDDPKLLKIFCNKEFLHDYAKLAGSFAKDSTEKCEYYLNLVEKIRKTGISDINNAISSAYNFIFQSYSSTQAFVLTALKDGEIKPICILPDYLNLSNSTAVHELNHIIEMDLVEEKGEKYRKCGFEAFSFYGEKENYNFKKMLQYAEIPNDKSHRKYERLNEIINDYLAVEITKLLEKDNFKLGLNECSSTAYSEGFILFKDFIEKHKKDIIECRLSNDRLSFARKIGMENFEELATLAREYLKIDTDEIKVIYREICETAGIKEEDLGEYLRHGDLDKDWSSDCEKVIKSFKKLREIENRIDLKHLSTIDEKDVAYEEERC